MVAVFIDQHNNLSETAGIASDGRLLVFFTAITLTAQASSRAVVPVVRLPIGPVSVVIRRAIRPYEAGAVAAALHL